MKESNRTNRGCDWKDVDSNVSSCYNFVIIGETQPPLLVVAKERYSVRESTIFSKLNGIWAHAIATFSSRLH